MCSEAYGLEEACKTSEVIGCSVWLTLKQLCIVQVSCVLMEKTPVDDQKYCVKYELQRGHFESNCVKVAARWLVRQVQ